MAKLPLEGVRVLDMTVVWAGPYATTLLGDMGAEIIRIESVRTMPPLTRGQMAHPPKALVQNMPPFAGGFPNRDPGDRPWNRYPVFNSHARNKKSVTVDLRTRQGQEVLDRLVKASDVFIDNNVKETMDKLNITYERFRALKDDFIMVRMPAYGDAGAYSGFRALGVLMANALGHGLARGYPDMDPSANSGEYVVDASAGTLGAAAVLMALMHRKRTGKGQFIELPSAQTFTAYMAWPMLQYTFNGRVWTTLGDRSDFALQGTYPCRGDDRWIVITICNDEEWQAFCNAIDNPEWTRKAEFEDHLSRYRHHDELDRYISAWTREQAPREAMERLQQAGVRAGMVMDAGDVASDPHLKARNFYQEAHQEDVGTFPYATAPFKFVETPLNLRRGPAQLGQDNEYVLKEVAGLSEAEYQALVDDGQVGMDYPEDMP